MSKPRFAVLRLVGAVLDEQNKRMGRHRPPLCEPRREPSTFALSDPQAATEVRMIAA